VARCVYGSGGSELASRTGMLLLRVKLAEPLTEAKLQVAVLVLRPLDLYRLGALNLQESTDGSEPRHHVVGELAIIKAGAQPDEGTHRY
jgi:hypothetical protein